MNIGIIGFGRFGKLLVKYLSKDNKVYVSSRKNNDGEIKKLNGIPASLEEVCKKDIVIPSVPISKFEEILKKIKNLLMHDSLVVDVCSVKEYPVKVMKQVLPNNVQILATHPMFGPDSATTALKGRKIVLCKVRIDKKLYNTIKKSLRRRGLIVLETSPAKHDREIAKSLLLTHMIGRSLIDFGANNLEIDSEGYKRLIRILETVRNDSEQLFKDMNNYNKYSKKVRDDFIKSLNKINLRLEK